jgi:hypothetical protein
MRPDALSGTVFGPAPSLAYLDGHGNAAGETTRTRVLPSRRGRRGVHEQPRLKGREYIDCAPRSVRCVLVRSSPHRSIRLVDAPRLLALVVLSLTLFHENFSG